MDLAVNKETHYSVFEFGDYREFLQRVGLPRGKYSHQTTNLKSWALRLGYKSPSSLAMVLNGHRAPSQEMIDALCEDFSFNESEKEYFELLVRLDKQRRKNKDVSDIVHRLSRINQRKNYYSLTAKEMEVMSEWYMLVVKNLVATPSFREDHLWIQKALRRKLTIPQIKHALETLESLDLLRRNAEGRLYITTHPFKSSNGISSAAIRKHHSGMMQRACEAIQEQAVDERQMSSLTLQIPDRRRAEAKKYIYKFMEEFNAQFSESTADELFQLNVQFFEHTCSAKKKGVVQ